MALESYLATVRSEMTELIKPYHGLYDDAARNSLILSVLSNEMPRYRTGEYSKPVAEDYSFRAVDAERFSVRTNAPMDNALKKTDAGVDTIVETIPLDVHEGQLACLQVTYAGTLDGATFTFDVKPDGKSDDVTVGSFLNESEAVVMTWGSVIFLDQYPTDHFVLRLKIVDGSAGTKIEAVRHRLLFVGDRSVLSRDINAIAYFSAAKVFDTKTNETAAAATRERVADQLSATAAKYRSMALGFLGIEKAGKAGGQVSGGAGGPVDSSSKTVNRSWDRFKGRA